MLYTAKNKNLKSEECKMTKRLLALLLAMVMCLSLFVACGNDGADETTSKQGTPDVGDVGQYDGELLFDEPFYIECTTYSVTDAERNNSAAVNAIKQATNVYLSYRELDNFDQQYALLLTDQKIPDLSFFWSNEFPPVYGPKGAFFDLMQYIDKMPNVKKAMEMYPTAFTEYVTADGEMYSLPMIVTGSTGAYQYLYRKDILEKHNLKWATSQEEFYQLLKDLKALYPNSYPFCIRNMDTGGVAYFARHFGIQMTTPTATFTYCSLDDPDTGKYYHAETANEMRECVTFINKLINEGLMLKTSLTMDTDGWQTAFASEKCFITYDKLDRLEVMNPIIQDENPEAKLVGGAPFAMGSNGTPYIGKAGNATTYSFAVGREANIDKMVVFLDWLYSDIGYEVTNWGLRGKHYTLNEAGEKIYTEECYKIADEANIGVKFATAFGYPGLCAISDYEAYLTSLDADTIQSYRNAEALQLDHGQAILRNYTDSEQMVIDMYGLSLQQWSRQIMSEFMSGERTISDAEWDWFVGEAKNRKVAQLIAVHEAAYARRQAEKEQAGLVD